MRKKSKELMLWGTILVLVGCMTWMILFSSSKFDAFMTQCTSQGNSQMMCLIKWRVETGQLDLNPGKKKGKEATDP